MYRLTRSLKKSSPHTPNVGTLCEVIGVSRNPHIVYLIARLETGDIRFSVWMEQLETHFEEVKHGADNSANLNNPTS